MLLVLVENNWLLGTNANKVERHFIDMCSKNYVVTMFKIFQENTTVWTICGWKKILE